MIMAYHFYRRHFIFSILLITGFLQSSHSRNVIQMSIDENEIDQERNHPEEFIETHHGRIPMNDKVQGNGDPVQFSFAKHFQNNMVLQRAPARANIYGFSPDIGQKVILQMNTNSKPFYYSTRVQEGSQPGVGVWSITLDPQPANTTASIKVLSERGGLNLGNLIFGDVWICGGQSNMQFAVTQMEGAAEELATVNQYPNIRLFTPALVFSPTPKDDLISILENWSQPSNDTVGHGDWKYFSAVCWLYGKALHKALHVPIGLVASNWGGTPVEAWSSPDALKKCGITADQQSSPSDASSPSAELPVTPDPVSHEFPPVGGAGDNSQLWNSMMRPFRQMTIKGAIWYQGEADAVPGKMDKYNCTFPTMIEDWRLKFSQASGQTSPTFPFGFVQLAPYRPDPTITWGFTDIRWHQTADVGFVPNSRMQNVFMAVAIDLPDYKSHYGSIHPQDKIDVGARLSLAGLAVAYGMTNLTFQGPFPSSGKLTTAGFVIDYPDSAKVKVMDSNGFEMLCDDTWLAAPIVTSAGNSVTIKSVCKDPKAFSGVRYAWRESPCAFKKCAIYEERNMLPGPPFTLAAKAGDRFAAFTTPSGYGIFDFSLQ